MPAMLKPSRVGALAFGLAAAASLAQAEGPCDIYANGGTPCVAAHSTTRALYASYSGPLYQLIRGSDGATQDIHPSTAGGVANASDQDTFCASTTCLINKIYDQSGHNNHLTQAPGGSAATGPEDGGKDYLAGAYGAPVTVNGQRAYGMFGSPMTGYRNDQPNSTAIEDDAEGLYAVFNGLHYNTRCCFDYGNAEITNTDPGDGHMEAFYFGTGDGWSGTGANNGPWVMADLENYLFAGGSKGKVNSNTPHGSQFVSGFLKGEPNNWALKGADANYGGITTYYSGIRPTDGSYNPMHKEGAIVLGVGGDNSDGSQGTFYEGAMTHGYPSDDTENKVQQNIISAQYIIGELNRGTTPFKAGDAISLQATTSCCTTEFVSHSGSGVDLEQQSTSPGSRAGWNVHQGLAHGANGDCFSFESRSQPGYYIRHSNYALEVDANDNSQQFAEDATFCTEAPGLNGQGVTIRSWSYPARYWRHFNSQLYIGSNGGPHDFDEAYLFSDDATWKVFSALG